MNDIKPIGGRCPKCQGTYDWTCEESHRCLNCGFVYNPRLNLPSLVRVHCTWGACLRPIADGSSIYCELHFNQARTRKAEIRRVKQLKKPNPKSTGDGQLRHNFPVSVRPIKNDSTEYEG